MKDDRDLYKDGKFLYPSPYVGKWKRVSGMLNATPESIGNDDKELAQRLSSYMNSDRVGERLVPVGEYIYDTALNRHRVVNADLANNYLKDYVDGDTEEYKNIPKMSEVLKSLIPDSYAKNRIILNSANDAPKIKADTPVTFISPELPSRPIVQIPKEHGIDPIPQDRFSNIYSSLAHELDHAKVFSNEPELASVKSIDEDTQAPYIKGESYYDARKRTNTDRHFHPQKDIKPLMIGALGSIAREAEAKEQFKNIRAALRK